jgi:hypothetical protein
MINNGKPQSERAPRTLASQPRLLGRRRRETPEEHAARLANAVSALEELARAGGIASIPDPAAWQREIREDRPLPGRED